MNDAEKDIDLQRFAKVWRQSRYDAGVSQDYVAKRMNITKKTVQNWEQGLSTPSQINAFRWFKAVDRQPLPYYLELLYPEFENLSPYTDDDIKIERALDVLLHTLPAYAKRELLYCAYGNHGSSPIAVLEMVTAYLHTPLRHRLNIAQAIATNYEVCKASNDIINCNHIMPHMGLLRKAIRSGRESILCGKETYTVMEVVGE